MQYDKLGSIFVRLIYFWPNYFCLSADGFNVVVTAMFCVVACSALKNASLKPSGGRDTQSFSAR